MLKMKEALLRASDHAMYSASFLPTIIAQPNHLLQGVCYVEEKSV